MHRERERMYGKSEARMATVKKKTSKHYNSLFGLIEAPPHGSMTVARSKHANARIDWSLGALVMEVPKFLFSRLRRRRKEDRSSRHASCVLSQICSLAFQSAKKVRATRDPLSFRKLCARRFPLNFACFSSTLKKLGCVEAVEVETLTLEPLLSNALSMPSLSSRRSHCLRTHTTLLLSGSYRRRANEDEADKSFQITLPI